MKKVLPVGRLLRLRKIPDPKTPADLFVLPAKIVVIIGETRTQLGNGTITVKNLVTPGGSTVAAMEVGEMFDSSAPALDLLDWLQQPFLRPDWTMRKFIGIVTNKDGGAHHDPNSALLELQQFGHFHWHLTAGIARSILPQIRDQLAVAYPGHVRPIR